MRMTTRISAVADRRYRKRRLGWQPKRTREARRLPRPNTDFVIAWIGLHRCFHRGLRFSFCNSCRTSSLCYGVLQMRETLTISLPKRLRRDLEKMAKAEGVTSSEYVRRAIKADLFRRALRAARRELVPQARARGIYTDEDVFKIVS